MNYKVSLLENFNTFVSDERGRQVPEMQNNLLVLWAEEAAINGIDPTGIVINGWRIVQTDIGFNLEYV